MHPELFGSIRAYYVFLVLAVVVGTVVSIVGVWRARLEAAGSASALALLTVLGLGGAKLYGLIERGGSFGPLSVEIFAQYRYPGGIVAVALGLLAMSRARRLAVGPLADVIAPSCAIAMGVVRVGCFLAGCCSGKVSSLPWAVHFPAHSLVWMAQERAGLIGSGTFESLPVHPLQIYFGLLAFSLGLFCLWLQQRKAFDGQVFLVYVSVYGIGQFCLEYLRFSPLPHIQGAALVSGTMGAAALVFAILRSKRPIAAQIVA